MLNHYKEKNLSYNTLKLIHAAADLLLDQAVEDGIINENPASGATVPITLQTVEELEEIEELPKFFEKEELARFLKIVKIHGTKQEYNIFYTLAYTGMRLGELGALKWKDFNKKEKYLSITKTLYYRGGIENYILNTPKTKSSKRKIIISPSLITVLENQFSWQKEFKMEHRKTYYEKGGFIFVNIRKKPGFPESMLQIQTRMKYFLALADLPSILSPHSLRHTHVSLLAEAGVSLEAIQKRLGHKNDNITREIYLHVTKKQSFEAPEKFDEIMASL